MVTTVLQVDSDYL